MKDMPQMGMGTFRLEGEEARVSVSKALDVGFRHIDTAQFYDNEAQVGDAIKTSGLNRNELFVTTKVWHESLGEDHFIPSVLLFHNWRESGKTDLILEWSFLFNAKKKK